MRKISLVLALILVLTCGVFAACSDDAAESSAPATSDVSKPATTPNDDASSKAPADDSSAPADESSAAPAPEVNAGTENLAAGKSYTASEQYKQGGADVQWGWDDNAPYAYPDEDGKNLTDGVKPAEGADMFVAEWAAWTGQHPKFAEEGIKITIDLGEVKDIAKVDIWYGTQFLGNGVVAPAGIEVLVENNGSALTIQKQTINATNGVEKVLVINSGSAGLNYATINAEGAIALEVNGNAKATVYISSKISGTIDGKKSSGSNTYTAKN